MTHIFKTVSLSKLNKIRDLGWQSLLISAALFAFSVLPTAVHAQASACVAGETLQNFSVPAGGWPAGSLGPLSFTVGTGVNAVTLTYTITNTVPSDAGLPNQTTHGGLPNVVRNAHTTAAQNASLSTQTVTFSRPINKFVYVATDVDQQAWQDQIVARANGTALPTSLVGGATHTINLATGTATATTTLNCANTDPACNVTANFNFGGINSASIEFRSGPTHGGAQQFVGWTNFGFCAPDIPTITIGTPSTVAEGTSTQNVITLSAASVQVVTVTLGTTFGTAVAADIGAAGTQTYSTDGGVTFIAVPASGILTIPAGVTTVQVRTVTIDDILTEPAETFSLNITAPTGAVLGAAATQTVLNTISASDPTTDMQAALGATTPTVVSPGQIFTGLTATCTNIGANPAINATCVPSVSAGTISALACVPTSPQASLAATAAMVCTYTYTAPGTAGGADEPTTAVTFTATTGAANDSVAGNNVVTVVASVIDAVNDAANQPGGVVGVTTNLATNDQFPATSTFTIQPGSTCVAPVSVSTAGVATYTVPATGTCTVNYQVCTATATGTPLEPCDQAALTVTATAPQASLVITKTDSKAVTSSGGTNNYVVTLTNQGPSPASGVIVTDVVGAGLTCPAANAVTCSVTGAGAVCPAGPLTIASLTAGVAVATLPSTGALQFAYTCNVN
jgi:uncharacterized repeat protein (TIGR01451 family)